MKGTGQQLDRGHNEEEGYKGESVQEDERLEGHIGGCS